MSDQAVFAAPAAPLLALGEQPRLESWNNAQHPDQLALRSYLDRVHGLLSGQLADCPDGPLSLSLQVGLPKTTDPLSLRDLDNYALPVARRLDAHGTRIVSVRAMKVHAAESYVAISAAVPDGDAAAPICVVECGESFESEGYKRVISDAVAAIGPVREGPVQLELRFATNERRRNWQHLWKPTIDALGPVLGHDPGAREWNARDGRITDLRLHRTVDPLLPGWTVRIGITARALVGIPDVDDEVRLIEYAYEYDPAVSTLDGLDTLADQVAQRWARGEGLPGDLDSLRRALYFLQRRHRHLESREPFGAMPIVRALLDKIRRLAPAGTPATISPTV